MEERDVPKYYEPTPTPTLYMGQVSNVLGCVPSMPLFFHGNATPTIPCELRKQRRSRFPFGRADAAQESGRRGRNVYEVNPSLWQFGCGKPRLGGLPHRSFGSTRQRPGSLRPGAAGNDPIWTLWDMPSTS